jgi:hypothetical protein
MVALGWLLAGATCFPLIDLDPPPNVQPSRLLTVTVLRPSVDLSVPMGTFVDIEWTATNLTGSEAIATILVRSRENGAETILDGGLRLPDGGQTRTLQWDTGDSEGGPYNVVARVQAGDSTDESSAPGRVTVNAPPVFAFTISEPEQGPEDPNAADDGTIATIEWEGFDPDGDGRAQIKIDTDRDRESGEETIIAEPNLPAENTTGSIDWTGLDMNGERVVGDTYYVYAIVSDGVNDDVEVGPDPNGLQTVTVPETFELAITEPSEDTTLVGDDPDEITIAFTLDEDDDVLIDFRIDPDENHRNGNETTIRARYLVEAGTNEDSIQWDGTDDEGNDVEDGIYRIFMAVNRGSGDAEIVAAEGLIFRRREADKPLIALLEPNTDVTLVGGEGGEVLIKWRDDDPSEVAKIRLTIDDDDTPNEGPEPDGEPEEVIPSADWDDLSAEGSGVQDTFLFAIGEDRLPGRYWIFAYIDRRDEAGIDHQSVAAGQLKIEDPDEPSSE